MRISRADKIILDKFFPNEKMKYVEADERKAIRHFKNSDGRIQLLICETAWTFLVFDFCIKVLFMYNNLHTVFARYQDKILVFITPNRSMRIVVDDNSGSKVDYVNDDLPYVYTINKSKCPYCGSKNIISHTKNCLAHCKDCGREYVILKFLSDGKIPQVSEY